MMNVTLIHRFIPHYRTAAFRRLHVDHGWRIASCASTGRSLGIRLGEGLDWVEPKKMVLFSAGKVALAPLYSLLKREPVDLVVSEFSLNISWCYEMALRAWLRRWLRGPKYAFYTHGFTPNEVAIRGVKYRLKRWMFELVDGVVCYTPESAERLRNNCTQRNVYSVRNTIDVGHVMASYQKSERVFPQRGVIRAVISNRLVRNKNIDIAIEAIKVCADALEGVRVSLLVIGEGELRGELQELSETLGAEVDFAGEVYDVVALGAYFRNCDVAIIPGSAGLFVNQAFAFGLPVIMFENAGDHHHHPEEAYVLDNETGVRINQKPNALALGQLLAELAVDVKRLEKLQDGATEYAARFLTLDRWVESMQRACTQIYASSS